MSLVDTHCHLDLEAFDSDRDAVIARAAESHVERILNPGIDLASCQRITRLSESWEMVYTAIGIHPNEALSWNEDAAHALRLLAKHAKVVAVGEIGLDYYWDRAPVSLQKKIFLAQLELAEKSGLPVIIHNREATQDVVGILAEWHAGLQASNSPLAAQPGVLHSFSADIATAKAVVNMNFLIGITGPVTFKKADELRLIVKNLSLENLLIETDAPYLTPHPFRGKRNEPAYVRFVAQKIAEIHGVPDQYVAEQTTQNAARLFKW